MKIARASVEKRTHADGTVFDSASELRRYQELLLMQRAGLISDLQRQVRFPLVIDGAPVMLRSARYPAGRRAIYTADFVYNELDPADGSVKDRVVEDSKGVQTDVVRLRIAVIEAIYHIRVRITGKAKIIKRRSVKGEKRDGRLLNRSTNVLR